MSSLFFELGSSKTVITMKTDREVKDLTSDPTWDKENDGDEDEAHDRVSSDEDWKPPKKKRSRHGVPLLPAKVHHCKYLQLYVNSSYLCL